MTGLDSELHGVIASHAHPPSLASFPDSTPQLFIAFIHSAIKSWGVESGNEARRKLCVLEVGLYQCVCRVTCECNFCVHCNKKTID